MKFDRPQRSLKVTFCNGLNFYGFFTIRSITPTFSKLDMWSLWGGFNSYYNNQCNELDKERKIAEKKVLCI